MWYEEDFVAIEGASPFYCDDDGDVAVVLDIHSEFTEAF